MGDVEWRGEPEESDYVVESDRPIMIAAKEMQTLIHHKILVEKEGGPWGATHWSPACGCWAMLKPTSCGT